jgi:GDP-mannose 6-dehydrogenase
MRIIVWGLGQVGTVSAACFAQMGHDILGVDVDTRKVEAIQSGRCAVIEPRLENLVREAVNAGRLQATNDGAPFIADADVSLMCVGTPVSESGEASYTALRRVSQQIGAALRESKRHHVVAMRSSVFPGVTREVVLPLLKKHSGRRHGGDFGLVVNPEFLREGTSIEDFFAPPFTVIGSFDNHARDVIEELFQPIAMPIYRVTPEEAELLKLSSNAFHSLKIGFANELGRLCERLDLDSEKISQILCADTKLNLSSAYLRPGFAFGGPCLPKDLRSLTTKAQSLGVSLPILEAVLPSNHLQVQATLEKIRKLERQRVGVLGLSFKPGTDDVRESPVLELVREMISEGMDVKIWDPDIDLKRMTGANRAYLDQLLPSAEQILRPTIDEVLDASEVAVVCQGRADFLAPLEMRQAHDANFAVIDLAHLYE